MAKSNKVGEKSNAGRPQLYPLTGTQVRMITTRLNNGLSVKKIADELDVHEFAVLRVKRSL